MVIVYMDGSLLSRGRGSWRALVVAALGLVAGCDQPPPLNSLKVCAEPSPTGCHRWLEQLKLESTINLAVPWRVAVADRNSDGIQDMAAAYGGDWIPQWIIGFSGAKECNGFHNYVEWVSQDLAYNSQIRFADISSAPGVELLASSYYGRITVGNSAERGSGIRIYKPSVANSVAQNSCEHEMQEVVAPRMLVRCAQVSDFVVVDVDADGDQDIVATITKMDRGCAVVGSEDCVDVDVVRKITSDSLGKLNLDSIDKLSMSDATRALKDISDGLKVSPIMAEPGTEFVKMGKVRTTSYWRDDERLPDQLPVETEAPGQLKNVLAVYRNVGTRAEFRFDPAPAWFAQLPGEPTRLAVFDVDQDGNQDYIVGSKTRDTLAILGGATGPVLTSGTEVGGAEAQGVLCFGDCSRVGKHSTSSLALALLPSGALLAEAVGASEPGEGHHVVLVESRLCLFDSCDSEVRMHIVGGSMVSLAEELLREAKPVALALMEGDLDANGPTLPVPTLLIGRGQWVPHSEPIGFPVMAVPLIAGGQSPRSLLATPVLGLDLAMMGEFVDGVAGEGLRKREMILRGPSVTLPGAGPTRIETVRLDDVEIPACTTERPNDCYDPLPAAGALLVRCGPHSPVGKRVHVDYQPARFVDVMIADARKDKTPVVAWDVRRDQAPTGQQ